MPGLIPDAGPGWESALLVPVPAAESAVGQHRARLDGAAKDCPPYGGRHTEVIPHLTIGHSGGPRTLGAAAESVRHCLPIEAAATQVILMAGPRPGIPGTPPGQWRTIAAFPLGKR